MDHLAKNGSTATKGFWQMQDTTIGVAIKIIHLQVISQILDLYNWLKEDRRQNQRGYLTLRQSN